MTERKYNVERAEFRLDTFQKILEAMDGYYVLPWLLETDPLDRKPVEVAPWDIDGMPNVSIDVWRYHVALAIDRGFVECWTPDAYAPIPEHYFDTWQFQRDEQIAQDELRLRPRYRGLDVDVSSRYRPARLTYAGKEFVDNLSNPSIKDQAVAMVKEYGVPTMLTFVSQAAQQLLHGQSSA